MIPLSQPDWAASRPSPTLTGRRRLAMPAFRKPSGPSWPGKRREAPSSRKCPGHPRLPSLKPAAKTWMPGTRYMFGPAEPDPSAGHDGGQAVLSRPQRLLNTCDQIAIMPMNRLSEASAAASWMTALNMSLSPRTTGNIVHCLFPSQADIKGQFRSNSPLSRLSGGYGHYDQ